MTGGRWANVNKSRAAAPAKARKVVIDGMTFDSITEGDRYRELRRQERQGKISNIECQISYPMVYPGANKPICIYIADFRYLRDGVEVVEDVKGGPTTDVFMLKKKMMLYFHGIKVNVVRRVGRQRADGRFTWSVNQKAEL